jgi:TonB-linked SusC/RagA family outer membrane protein
MLKNSTLIRLDKGLWSSCYKFFVVCLTLMTTTLSAQTQTASGTIISDKDKSPLVGASVMEKGTTNGTIADVDGNFSLRLAKTPATLVVSFVGHNTKEFQVTGAQSGISIELAEGVLNEVVVTAFGMSREKKALPYAVTQLEGTKFQEVRTANLGNALSGKVAGVNISPPSTGAGGSSRITIRGGSSLGGNDQPLFVVNGVPMESSNFGQAGLWGGNDQGDGLAMFNPDDIENVSVLKGNTAAALYGARAANGVIMITTKSGKSRKGMGITFNSNLTSDRAIDRTDFQNQYGQGLDGKKFTTQTEALDNSTQIWGSKFDGANTVQFDGVQRPYSNLGETINGFYRTGQTLNNALSFSGGNESGNYRLAVSDLRNNDIMPNASFTRQTANLNVNSKMKKLTLSLSTQYTKQNAKNRPRLSDSPGNANFSVITKPANIPYSLIQGIPDAKGDTKLGAKADLSELRYQGNTFVTNPYWAANQFFRSDITDRLVGNTSARYDITDWLYVMGRLGTDLSSRDEARSEGYGTAYIPFGSYTEQFQTVRQDNVDIFVGGNKSFGKISLDYLGGGTRSRSYSETKGAGGGELVVPFFHSLNNVKAPSRIFGYSATGVNSIFGNVNVGYNSWLYLNLTGRQDQFSTLSSANNTLFYPSVGVSAVLSDAVKLPDVVTFAKVRTSWAQVGGGAPNPYALNVTYGLQPAPHGNANLGQINNGAIPNPNLSPYASTELEVGADLRFFRDRLGIDFTFYNRKTTNDILNAGISATSGFGGTTINIGELTNKGIELMVNGTIIDKKDFQWEASFNFSNNTSEAVNLGKNAKGEPIQFLNYEESRVRGGERVRHILGQQLGVLVGYKHRTDAQGRKFYDANGYPVRTADVEILGMGRHPIAGGLSNTFRYKGVQLSFLVDLRKGGKMFSATNRFAYAWGLHQETLAGREGDLKVDGVLFDAAANKPTDQPISVTIPKDRIDNYWGAYAGITENTVYDASFAKLRELSIGYTIRSKNLKKTPFESVSISLVGRNLALLWSKIPNVDPESGYTVDGGSQGLEFFAMPQTRTMGLNLTANF